MVEKIDSVTAADALFATRNNIDDDDDDNNNNDTYQPLPLSDFAKYQQLVSLLYKTSFAVMLGNSLEWLDFSIYSYSEGEISSQLFGGNKSAGWATFGLGFAFRPIGAYVLGRLSDEKSRKLSFILAMLSGVDNFPVALEENSESSSSSNEGWIHFETSLDNS